MWYSFTEIHHDGYVLSSKEIYIAREISKWNIDLFFSFHSQLDEEKAQIEEVLQRGEEMLQHPMEENRREEIRL